MANSNTTMTPTLSNPIWAVGRRKTSVARVRLVPGQGRILINSKSVEDYFGGHARHKYQVMRPLQVAGRPLSNLDLFVDVEGGGVTGQAEAIRLGLARALFSLDPRLKPALRKEGLLTRDSRMVERKKAGQPKARKRFQHSKR